MTSILNLILGVVVTTLMVLAVVFVINKFQIFGGVAALSSIGTGSTAANG